MSMMVSYFVALGVCQIYLSYAQIIFQASFAGQGILSKDPTIWLDGARPPPVSLIMRSTISPFCKLNAYEFMSEGCLLVYELQYSGLCNIL